MLKKTVIISSLFLGLFVFILSYQMMHITSKDRILFEQLTTSSQPKQEEQKDPLVSRQARSKVQKNIWFSKDSNRLHFRLYSSVSELVYSKAEESTEVVEHLTDIQCYMQEKLFYQLEDGSEAELQPNGRLLKKNGNPTDPSAWLDPSTKGIRAMQRIRHIIADEAIYRYEKDQFQANHVHIARYDLPGHTLSETLEPQHLIMDGMADQVEFYLRGEDVNFHARNLKATFFTPKGIL